MIFLRMRVSTGAAETACSASSNSVAYASTPTHGLETLTTMLARLPPRGAQAHEGPRAPRRRRAARACAGPRRAGRRRCPAVRVRALLPGVRAARRRRACRPRRSASPRGRDAPARGRRPDGGHGRSARPACRDRDPRRSPSAGCASVRRSISWDLADCDAVWLSRSSWRDPAPPRRTHARAPRVPRGTRAGRRPRSAAASSDDARSPRRRRARRRAWRPHRAVHRGDRRRAARRATAHRWTAVLPRAAAAAPPSPRAGTAARAAPAAAPATRG